MESNERLKIINHIGKMTIIANVVLCAAKLLAGILANSGAMFADAIHTLSDVITTVIVMVGAKFASKPDDDDHPYGHERIEAIVSIFMAIALIAVAVGIGYNGINNIINGTLSRPGTLALVAAIISIAVKEWMYRYTVRAAKKINSPSLKADAWHHRSDALSSIGTLIGIGGAIAGFEILDPIAAIIVCIMIIHVGIEIYMQAYNQLVDKSAGDDVTDRITEILNSVDGVCHIDNIKTRMHGPKIFADIEISVDKNISVSDGHEIAQKVHDKIEADIPDIKHCMVHVNPWIN